MPVDEDDDELFALLDDEYARSILVATSVEPMAAGALAEHCGASEPTIYRRIDRLESFGLLASDQQLDPDGHHYKTYRARLERVTIELEDGDLTVEVDRTEDAADRFTRLYEELR
jgi:predicted transcriptional regulator